MGKVKYLKTIGFNSNQPIGRRFNYPYDIDFSEDGRIFMINRTSGLSTRGVRIQIFTFNEEWLGEFATGPGKEDDQFTVPVCLAISEDDKVFITDEYLNEVKIFDNQGGFVKRWGSDYLKGPAGIAHTEDGNLLVVEQYANRISKYSRDGDLLHSWGEEGDKQGQFNLPWGMSLDKEGNVFVADWRNDRVQSFTADGKWLATFGSPGEAKSVGTGGNCYNARVNGGIKHSEAPVGTFNRPTGVCVDQDGDIYIADWLNNRVQVLTPEGRFITEFTGDGDLSNMGISKLRSNPDMIRQRNGIRNFTPERVLWAPCAVRIAQKNRVIIADTTRHRFQIYRKNTEPVLV